MLEADVRMWNKTNTSSIKNHKFDRMKRLETKTTKQRQDQDTKCVRETDTHRATNIQIVLDSKVATTPSLGYKGQFKY